MFKKYLVLFFLCCIVNTGFATDALEFQSWVHGKKMMNISVDDSGKIAGILYKDDKELNSKYYYVDRDYTCAESLEPDFGAQCHNTCFPSYNQKGIEFFFNAQGDIVNACSSKLTDVQYQGFKATRQEIDCREAKLEITRVGEFGKYQDLINQGSNHYFKDIAKTLGVEGLIVKFIVTKKETNQNVLFYEVMALNLKKDVKPIELPKKYRVIKPEPFLSRLVLLENQVRKEADQKFATLYQEEDSETKLKLLAIKNECKTRFPAQNDETLLMEICRQDPKTKVQIDEIMGTWQEKIQSQINPEVRSKFAKGTQRLLEEFCKTK